MTESEFVKEIIEKYTNDEELRELLIVHSRSVADKAMKIADACGLDVDRQFVYDAAMLHDIGVTKCNAPGIHCHGTLPYICHGIAGSEILREEGIDERYRRVCERHTGSGITANEIRDNGLPIPVKDYLPETLEEKLICYADKFFSKSSNPEVEKNEDRIFRSMQKFGDDAVRRLEELKELFTPKS